MTPAQDKAFDQIQEIMREHFDGGAFVVLANLEGEEHGREEVKSGWNGGKCQAVGLFMYGADMAREIVKREVE